MKKLRTFFYCLYRSATSPKYYGEILKTKTRFTTRYYIALTLFAALLTTLVASARMFPTALQEASSLSDQVKDRYPSGLVITLKDGQWSTNKPEPVIIPLPKSSGDELGDLENLVVFYKQGTVEDLKTFKTLILVNEVNIVVSDPSGTITSRPLKNYKDVEINSESVNMFSGMILKYSPYVLVLYILVGSIFFYLFSNLSSVLLIGAAVYVFAKSNKKKLKFVETLRIAAHTLTIPIILQVIVGFVWFPLPNVYWFFALNLILALVVTLKLPVSELEVKTPPQLNA